MKNTLYITQISFRGKKVRRFPTVSHILWNNTSKAQLHIAALYWPSLAPALQQTRNDFTQMS